MNNNESYVRFAFDKFNSEQWSLEHIHAQQDKGLQSSDAKRVWLKDAKEQTITFLDEEKNIELLGKLDSIVALDKIEDEDFQEVETDIFSLFGTPEAGTIDNLALLSSEVNSSLSNNIFPIKRNILVSKDKSGEFIPICTKNVFLKYYSTTLSNTYYWSDQDRSDYLSEINRVLNMFLGGKDD